MIYWIVVLVLVQGLLTNAQNETISPNCQVVGNATLEECLQSFVYKWDDIRKVKPQIDALVYPLWTMTIDEVRSLCIRVEEAQANCGRTPVERCDKNEVARFIQQNFIYACNSKQGSLFGDESECLLSTITSKQECVMLLKKTEDELADGCIQLQEFFKCIHSDVHKFCKAKGVAALVHGIDRFGCDVGKLDARIGAQDQALPNCLPPDWQAVTNCFQPLLNMWAEIRDNDTSLLETGFPIFKFDRTDLAKMCEMAHGVRDQCSLQIQRCPSHQLPEFTNSILGLACGTQQAVFFLSYDCIRKVILENTQCHGYIVGAWQPGHLKETCGRMPQFYKCLEKPIAAKCANDGVNVLAQSIRQFGCELNVDPLPPAATTRQETPTTTSASTTTTARTTAAVLPPASGEVGGAPGSKQALAPATNIFVASSSEQQGLPGQAAAPFLSGAPSPIPPLRTGPQEPLFNLPVVAQQQAAPGAAATVAVPQPAPPAPITQAPAAPAAGAPSQSIPAAPAAQQVQPQQPIQPPVVPQPTQQSTLATQQPPAQQPVVQQTSQKPSTQAVQQPAQQPAQQAAVPPSATQAGQQPQPAAAAQSGAVFQQPQIPAQPSQAQAPPVTQTPGQPAPQTPAPAQTQAPTQPLQPVQSPALPAQPQQPAPAAPIQPQQPATPAPDTPSTTTRAPTPLPGVRKPVQPIPLVPHLLAICDIDRRNQARKCLHPLFKRWVVIHTRMLSETHRANLTFPLYHYARSEVIELCDQYATAFLQCPFSVFQECLQDEVVFLANAILGYTCSPQNLPEYTRHFDCISTIVQARNQCSDPINGPLLIGRDETTRCAGIKKFYECNKPSVKESCTSAAERVFKETVRQFGCELNVKH